MTIENLLFRFLKENGIYNKIKTELVNRNEIRNNKPNHLLDRHFFSSACFTKYGLGCAFYFAFTYFRIFSGDSTSSRRRRFYRLNKKWKDFIRNKCFLQHNIKANDIVTCRSLWSAGKAKVLKVRDNTMFVRVKRIDTGYERIYNIFNITDVNDVKPVLNLYYKDENGNCYGKIDGDYNEIQL